MGWGGGEGARPAALCGKEGRGGREAGCTWHNRAALECCASEEVPVDSLCLSRSPSLRAVSLPTICIHSWCLLLVYVRRSKTTQIWVNK